MNEQQNSHQSLELLAAMRHFYNQAKKIHHVTVGFSIFLPILSIYLVSLYPQAKISIGAFAAIWVGASWLLSILEKKFTHTAATIQEQFDTSLFEIPWNKVLVGEQVTPERIKKASKKISVDQNQLMNWYTGLNSSRKELNILLAQRTNLTWDSNQRIKYAMVVAVITMVYLIFVFIYGRQLTTEKMILTLLLPSASIIVHGFKTSYANWTRAKQCENLAKDILRTIESVMQLSDSDIHHKSRQYQDVIFQKRCDTTLLPNCWYKLWRNEGEETMRIINEDISNRIT